jgi:hypothetical protein
LKVLFQYSPGETDTNSERSQLSLPVAHSRFKPGFSQIHVSRSAVLLFFPNYYIMRSLIILLRSSNQGGYDE